MVDAVLDGSATAAIYDVDVLMLLAKNSDCQVELVGDVFGPQEYGYQILLFSGFYYQNIHVFCVKECEEIVHNMCI